MLICGSCGAARIVKEDINEEIFLAQVSAAQHTGKIRHMQLFKDLPHFSNNRPI